MSNSGSREMTLDEYIKQLPESHRARVHYNELCRNEWKYIAQYVADMDLSFVFVPNRRHITLVIADAIRAMAEEVSDE